MAPGYIHLFTDDSKETKAPVPSPSEPMPKSNDTDSGELNANLLVTKRLGRNADDRYQSAKQRNTPQMLGAGVVRKYHNNHIEKALRVLEQNRATASHDPKSWLSIAEIPTSRELMDEDEPWYLYQTDNQGEKHVVINPNTIAGAWPSIEDYLQTFHGLLREDAVQPLRVAITHVRQFPHCAECDIPGGGSIGIYSRVFINSITMARRGLGIRICFSLNKVGRQIRWEQSKRLVTGSLVALSPVSDSFRTTCLVAVVAARPLDRLHENPPKIDIFFARPEEIPIDPTVEYIMVEERTSYFEALRHTMKSLQQMSSEAFPLSPHIVDVQDKVPMPRHIHEKQGLNLSSVFGPQDQFISVDIAKSWPKTSDTSLDPSQRNALRHILSRRVAIVQGPPGTGKTHVSNQAIKTLLDNMTADDPPIIVACQTNHALDSLMCHIAEYYDQFIRLGGRSKDNGLVKARTLFNIRKTASYNIPGGIRNKSRAEMRKLVGEIEGVLLPLNDDTNQSETGLLNQRVLQELGILTEEQCRTLEKGDPKWVTGDAGEKSALELWLGSQLLSRGRSYTPDTLGFDYEEIDLELEQVKEAEAENVIDDDTDFETLQGPSIGIWSRFAAKSSNLSDAKVVELLQQSLWKIRLSHRGSVFNYLLRQAKEKIQERFRELAIRYCKQAERCVYGGWERDAIYLRQTKLIGVTTTGLSKYRPLIASVLPKVLIIEEAAETLEPPVIAGCVETVQHLILVGDHKQLMPQTSVKELSKPPFHLNVSLFERLVNNGMPFKTLKLQRRMIPEISRLLTPIYGNEIADHPSMLDCKVRAPVPGMGGVHSFFYHHNFSDATDEHRSSTNPGEADMVVGMFDHLISNGLGEEQITVITFYNGQRKLILRKLREHPRLGCSFKDQRKLFNVVTVDSFQGEQNEVILLSLVKNNINGKIGFTGVDNRVCVALSRAKRGLYIFGNAELLACESRLWSKIIDIMLLGDGPCRRSDLSTDNSRCRVVFNIPLRCQNHNELVYIKDPADWDEVTGGCLQPCQELLDCGHRCNLKCHPFGHEKISCARPCSKSLPCSHDCSRSCYEKCSCEHCGGRKDQINPGLEEAASVAAWQHFAGGGHVQADAKMEQQRQERFHQFQAQRLTQLHINKDSNFLNQSDAGANDRKVPIFDTPIAPVTPEPPGFNHPLSTGTRAYDVRFDRAFPALGTPVIEASKRLQIAMGTAANNENISENIRAREEEPITPPEPILVAQEEELLIDFEDYKEPALEPRPEHATMSGELLIDLEKDPNPVEELLIDLSDWVPN